jgi:cell division protein FtsB
MLFANVVGDFILICLVFALVGLFWLLYHIGYWLAYLCAGKHGRRYIRRKRKAEQLKFAEQELASLHAATDAKTAEVNRLNAELDAI